MISLNLYFRFQNNLFLVNACFHCCFDNLPNSQKRLLLQLTSVRTILPNKNIVLDRQHVSPKTKIEAHKVKNTQTADSIFTFRLKKIRAYVTWTGREENSLLTQNTNLSRIFQQINHGKFSKRCKKKLPHMLVDSPNKTKALLSFAKGIQLVLEKIKY